jgi:hypothetical protein
MNPTPQVNQHLGALATILGLSFDSSSLFASLIWGALGGGMFMFGWKQKSMVPLGCGLAIVMISYFIDTAGMMSLASVVVLVIMYWLKRQGY